MKSTLIIAVLGCCLSVTGKGEDFLDRVDDALTLSSQNGAVKARLSGLVDLENYLFTQPAQGLVTSSQNYLFNPRFTFFVDAQLGSKFYFFAQTRVDRGFDPGDRNVEARFDEYALRFNPWEDGRLNVQVGKFAAVIGNWKERHLSWENPFITAPLAYENLTRVSDRVVPPTVGRFLYRYGYGRYDFLPIIWGPSYSTGASVAGQWRGWEFAAEVKNSGPSSRPESWSGTDVGFDHPVVNARVGFRLNEAWKFGLSMSEGPFLRSETVPYLPSGTSLSDFRQILIGQDVSYAWRHFQFWGEFYETRFNIPQVGNVDAFSYYLEGKYKFTPQVFGALRWNQQIYGTVPYRGTDVGWGRDTWRIDASLGYRFTAHIQAKIQYSFQKSDSSINADSHLAATQLTVRF